jgi:hypothetical protein
MAQDTAIPRSAADRYALTFANFVEGVRGALALAPDHPSVPRWKQKGLLLLSRDLDDVQAAMKRYEEGDPQLLVQSASSAMSLAKKTDGFPLNLAGEESGKMLEEQRRFVVMAAWQVLNAAGMV